MHPTAYNNQSVNLHRHLAPPVLDDLQHLGTSLLTVRKTAGPTQSTVYSHSFTPWHLETNSRRHWKYLHRLLTGRMLQTGSPILPKDQLKQPLSQGLVIRLLDPVGDHLSSLGSLLQVRGILLGGQSSSTSTTASEAIIGIDDFGLEIDQLNQLPLRDIGEIPLLHSNLVLGDLRLQGNLVMVLGVSPGITISSGGDAPVLEAQ
jgi:hypothetical protein